MLSYISVKMQPIKKMKRRDDYGTIDQDRGKTERASIDDLSKDEEGSSSSSSGKESRGEKIRGEETKATNHSTGFLRVDGLHEEGVSGEGGPT